MAAAPAQALTCKGLLEFLSLSQELRTQNESDLHNNFYSWWYGSRKKSERLESLKRELLQLQPSERNSLLEHLKTISLPNPKGSWEIEAINTYIALALYDKATWINFIADVSGKSLPDSHLDDNLAPLFENMPKELLVKLQPTIAEVFPVAYSKSDRNHEYQSGKRILSFLIALSSHVDQSFSKDLSSEDALKKYDEYLQNVRRFFPNYPQYGSKDVISSLLVIHKWFNEFLVPLLPEGYKVATFKSGEKYRYPLELYVAGSFPSGRANLEKSDLDLSGSPIIREFFKNNREAYRLLNIVTELVNTQLQLSLNSKSHLVSEGLPDLDVSFFYQLNPIIFKITEKGIWMLVKPHWESKETWSYKIL